MARHINSLSDQTLADLKRELQQLRNDTSNLRRHLAHVGARHREAVWVPAGAVEYLYYAEAFLQGSYTPTNYRLFPEVSGANTGCLAFEATGGSETSVGWTHDNSETNPYTNGNFTITKNGIYVVAMNIRVKFNIISPYGAGMVNYYVTPYVKRGGAWTWDIADTDVMRVNVNGLNWTWVTTDDNDTVLDETHYTFTTVDYMILKVDDIISYRTGAYPGYAHNQQASLSQAQLAITRVSDTATDPTIDRYTP